METDSKLAEDPALDPEERERQQADEDEESSAGQNYRRTTYVVDRDFQYRFATTWLTMMLLYIVLVGGIFYGSSLFIEGPGLNADALNFLENLLRYAGLPAIMLTILFALYFILLAHRIAGPEYRLKRAMRRIASGDVDFSISLRRTDYLKSLAERVNGVLSALQERREKINELREEMDDLHERLEVQGEIPDRDLELIGRIGRELDDLQSSGEEDEREGEPGQAGKN